MVTESRDFVVVDAELMRNVDSKPLFSHLRSQKKSTDLKLKYIYIYADVHLHTGIYAQNYGNVPIHHLTEVYCK